MALSTPDGLEVRSGCQHHMIDWWHAEGEALGRREGYTDAQIADYKRHFAYIEDWDKQRRSQAASEQRL